MFKKTTLVRTEKLSGQSVKRLKKDMTLHMQLTDEEVEQAVPGKADVSVLRLSNRALVYAVDGRNPIVFDPVRCARLPGCIDTDAGRGRQEGEGDLYPTVYLLWAFPHALPALLTHSEVSPKILGGADLMLQARPRPAHPRTAGGVAGRLTRLLCRASSRRPAVWASGRRRRSVACASPGPRLALASAAWPPPPPRSRRPGLG